jgi:hypothetical protein
MTLPYNGEAPMSHLFSMEIVVDSGRSKMTKMSANLDKAILRSPGFLLLLEGEGSCHRNKI